MFEAIGAIGRMSIILGFAASAFAVIQYFRGLQKPKLVPQARIAFHLTATGIFLAAASLMILIVSHRFEYQYVWAYSGKDLPLGLLMSTFYAGQEGSFMLWTVMVAVIGVILLAYSQKHQNEREVMGVYSGILAFLLLLLVVKNPFAPIEADFIPQEGRGLNPLLQNFWMQIHPPILFVGFAAMAPPFAMAIAAMMQRKYQNWIVSALPWVVGGSMVLGLGIALGGFWAYETLGWGGWWGWDPVENSSLIPWIISVGAVHTMLTQKRTKGLILTNFILVILSFVLVLYSTFLTRSGVLGDASVHSFVDPGRFAFTLLVLFMFVFSDVGLALIFARFTKWGKQIMERFSGWKLVGVLYLIMIVPSIPIFAQISGDVVPVFEEFMASGDIFTVAISAPFLVIAHILNVLSFLWIPAIIVKTGLIVYTLSGRVHSTKRFESFSSLSRESYLGWGSALLGALTLIVLLGTSLPIIPDVIVDGINGVFNWVNGAIGTSFALGNTVEPAFYDAMGLPLAIAMAVLNALALLLKWKANDGKDFLKKTYLPFGLAVAFAAALYFFGNVQDPGMLALGLSAAFSFSVNVQVGYKIMRGNPSYTGAYIAHIGFAMMLIGIIGSGFYSEDKPLELPMGVSKAAFGYNFTYVGYEPFWNGERYYFKVRVDDQEGKEIETVNTIMFVSNYGNQEQIMRNPGIAKFFEKDLYLEPQAVMQPDPEGGERVTMVKGMSHEFGGYTVTFTDFEMNNSMRSENFSVGGVFTVEKYGEEPQTIEVSQTTGPEGVQEERGLTEAGDLEITILGMTPNRTELSQSTVDVRLKNPNVPVDPENLRETLVVMATLKPFISLVWIGIILMVLGFGVARARRAYDAKRLEAPGDELSPPIPLRKDAIAKEDQATEEPESVPVNGNGHASERSEEKPVS